MDWLMDFREEHPKTYRIALRIFSQLIAILLVTPIIFGGVWAFREVFAEELQPQTIPLSDNCIEDSKVGIIVVAYCESDFGPDYYVNSLGMMFLAE